MDSRFAQRLAPRLREKLLKAGFRSLADFENVTPTLLGQEIHCSVTEALDILKTVRGAQPHPPAVGAVASGTSEVAGESVDIVLRELDTSLSSASALLARAKRPLSPAEPHPAPPPPHNHHHPGAPNIGNGQKTLAELLEIAHRATRMTTLCPGLDDLLGADTLCPGRITEICGTPGVGKTQLAMQLCIVACLPSSLGGLDGEAIYIDTEGSFVIERFVEMATAILTELTAARCGAGAARAPSMTDLLNRVYVYRVHDHLEQVALVQTLEDTLRTKRVRFVVVDSIAFHFRYDFSDLSLRNRLLTSIASTCLSLSRDYQIVFVFVNQMTTRFQRWNGPNTPPDGRGEQERTHFVSALGDSWGHMSSTRVVLHRTDTAFVARLLKSNCKGDAEIVYRITSGGLRNLKPAAPQSISPPTSQPIATASASPSDGSGNGKRPRAEQTQ